MGNQFEDMERAQKEQRKIYLITVDGYDQRDGADYKPVAVFVDNKEPNILVTMPNGSVWESKETFVAEVDALRWWIQHSSVNSYYLNVPKYFIKIERISS